MHVSLVNVVNSSEKKNIDALRLLLISKTSERIVLIIKMRYAWHASCVLHEEKKNGMSAV